MVAQGAKITDYFIKKDNKSFSALKDYWGEKKFPTNKIRLVVKNPSCLVRYFSFPKMDKKKMSQALVYEMNKFIPFSAEDVYYDYQVLNEINPSEVFILLAVAKKDYINKLVESFEKINLRVTEISLDSICLLNLYLNNYPKADKENACLLDMGYSFSTMSILKKGIPFLTRDVKFSTKDAFQVISRIKDKTPAEIEKVLLSGKKNKEFLGLIQDSISSLCKEMKNSFDYFEVNESEHVDKLYITGGLSSLAGIKETFKEALDAEVEILEVIPKGKELVGVLSSNKEFNTFKNSLSAAFGLVL